MKDVTSSGDTYGEAIYCLADWKRKPSVVDFFDKKTFDSKKTKFEKHFDEIISILLLSKLYTEKASLFYPAYFQNAILNSKKTWKKNLLK